MPRRPLLLSACLLGLALLGLVQAMLGPALPAWEAAFGAGPATLGALVGARSAGSLAATLLAGWWLGRAGGRPVFATSAALLALGAAGHALAPSEALLTVASLVLGVGIGAMSVAGNLLLGSAFGAAGASLLNLANGLFGLAATAGPALVAATLEHGAASFWAPAAMGVAALALALPARFPGRDATPSAAGAEGPAAAALAPADPGEALPDGPAATARLARFVLLFALTIAFEVSASSFLPTHLLPVAGERGAALWTAAFWAAVTAGRFATALVASRLRPRRLVLVAASGAALGAALAGVRGLEPLAWVAAGLLYGPVFPTAMAWLQRSFPRRAAAATSLAVAGASAGALVAPPLLGVAVEALGPAVVPWALAGLAALLLGVGSSLPPARPAGR